MINLDDHTNWCLSGGAIGADLLWGKVAGLKGHGVVHFSFKRHRTGAPRHEIVELSAQQLQEADHYCRNAGNYICRHFPPNSNFVANLLRRNWYQVRDADACYAISSIKDGMVQGGTGWATAMFILKHNMVKCPVYVFDQDVSHWFQWTGAAWEPIYEPPPPQGVWAGIGTRKLNWVGSLAIKVLMDYAPTSTKSSYYHSGDTSSVRRFTISSGE